MLEVNNLSVSFGSTDVLRNVSFDVSEGDITIILGPNGSGKTTLLRCILGIQKYSGSIRVNGRNVGTHLDEIGYVPQQLDIDRTFPITVLEFMRLFMKKKVDDSHIIEPALREVDMWSHAHSRIGSLSGGQLQRVVIASAILHMPKLLILDEPTSGIDMGGVRDFYDLLRHLNERHGITVLMVSHEVNVAHSFADTIVCLNKDLVCFGAPKEVLTDKVVQDLYGQGHVVRPHDH